MANYNTPWNKGKTGIFSEEALKRISEAAKKRTRENNPMWGKHHTEKSKLKISEAKSGSKLNEETKLKISKATKGENNPFYGSHHTKEAIEKIRIANKGLHSGGNHPNYGKHSNEETIERMRLSHLGKHPSLEIRLKMSKARKGKQFTEEHKRRISEAKKGEKNPMYGKLGEESANWQGGISFEPYAPEFNRQLKESIRQRDGYKCQLCGMPECENIENLTIHHIDYVKKNCLPDNLIALCRGCNAKVNFNRDYWENYFNGIKLNLKYLRRVEANA